MPGIDVQLIDGDLPINTHLIKGIELTAQRLRARLELGLGEWLLDSGVGLPYLAWSQQKPPDTAQMGVLLRRTVESTPGILRVEDWQTEFDADTQTVEASGTATTESGTISVRISPFSATELHNVLPSVVLVL